MPHSYTSSGNYGPTATSRDSTGDTGSLSTTVIIGSLPIILNASPNPAAVNSPVTYTVGGVGSAQVDHYLFTFDDGTSFPTSSPQFIKTWTSRGLKNARVDVFGVGGGKIGSAPSTIDVQ